MKTTFPTLLFLSFFSGLMAAQPSVSILARQHQDQSDAIEDRPYGDGDTSYGLFLDLFDGPGAWRFGASYADDLTGVEGVKRVITPEIGLLAVDNIWEAGISALMDYVETEEESDWGDVYFQASVGLNIGLSAGLSVGIHGSYPFEDLEDLSDFDTGDLEYAASVRLRF